MDMSQSMEDYWSWLRSTDATHHKQPRGHLKDKGLVALISDKRLMSILKDEKD